MNTNINKTVVGIIVASLVLLIGGASLLSSNDVSQTPPHQQCVTHGSSLSMHIHPSLEINLNGSKYPVPANIGVSPSCMMSVHTHDDSGTLHLEYPSTYDFKLGHLFENWGQTFNKAQIFDKTADDNNEITMTVDGATNTEFENLTLKDGQKIVISYSAKSQTPTPSSPEVE